MKNKGASFTFLALAIPGCTHVQYVYEPLSNRIPASYLQYLPRPVPGPVAKQSGVARLLVDIDTAGSDCRSKITGIRQIVQADADAAKGN